MNRKASYQMRASRQVERPGALAQPIGLTGSINGTQVADLCYMRQPRHRSILFIVALWTMLLGPWDSPAHARVGGKVQAIRTAKKRARNAKKGDRRARRRAQRAKKRTRDGKKAKAEGSQKFVRRFRAKRRNTSPGKRGKGEVRVPKMRVGVVLDQGSHMPISERNTKLWRKMAKRLRKDGVTDVRIEVPMVESLYIGKPRRWRDKERRLLRNIRILRKEGLEVEAVVGFGSNGALPDGLSVDDDDYIERVSRNVFDVVKTLKRYGITRFQIENELNTAGQAALMQGWRTGDRWWDWGFKRDLMKGLTQAARRANPDAVLTTNIFDGAFDPLRTPRKPSMRHVAQGFLAPQKSFEKALVDLGQYVDEIGLDAYPNYIAPYHGGWNTGKPPASIQPKNTLGRVPRAVLALAKPIWKHVGAPAGSAQWPLLFGMKDPAKHIEKRLQLYQRVLPGKAVYVAETGVPSQTTTGHTKGGQALYIEAALHWAKKGGAHRAMVYHYYDPTEEDHLRYGMPADRVENGQRKPGLFGIDANSHDQHEGKFGVRDEYGREKKGKIHRRKLVWKRWRPGIRTEVREVSAVDVVRKFIREQNHSHER